MRKITFCLLGLITLVACAKHDPILPGVRSAIFSENKLNVLNTTVANLPETLPTVAEPDCPYTQTSTNVISNGTTKIFSGFPTQNSVISNQKPICHDGYVYAGLTTGEVIKVAPKSRMVSWVADVYKTSTMTGGSSVVDIVAPIVYEDGYIYAVGLGDAFCKLNASSGTKKWCIEIGSAYKFILLDNVIYVVGTDDNLYAVRKSDGAIYWSAPVLQNAAPEYNNRQIIVGTEKFDASTGIIQENKKTR